MSLPAKPVVNLDVKPLILVSNIAGPAEPAGLTIMPGSCACNMPVKKIKILKAIAYFFMFIWIVKFVNAISKPVVFVYGIFTILFLVKRVFSRNEKIIILK